MVRVLSRLLVVAVAVLGGAGARAQGACEQAGTAAEKRHGVPPGLLNAIGRVESGRRDPASGRVATWPWTINAEGRGTLFDGREDALAGTRRLREAGVTSVDVGCFQVNLMHHPTAFATLDEAFDPERNADYAARFLVTLRDKAGSWEQAVAFYHSATPERGNPYRDRVLASWRPGEAGPGAALPAPPPFAAARASGPVVIRMASGAPSPGGIRVWTPSAPGQAASLVVMPGAPMPGMVMTGRAPRG